MNRLWELLPADVRAQIDEELAAGSTVRAIQLVHTNHGIDVFADDRPTLQESREATELRRDHLVAEGLLPHPSAADLPSVLARVRLLAAPVEAVQTVWVEGADGPYPRMMAVLRAEDGTVREVGLAALPGGEPAEVAELGAGLSAALGVPFRSASH
ncbi:hypothetical protein ACQP00_13500 [Dactylosporangium sp. CS-047395]|uniref:hypothetical protein n=1 Tax=Dactylosporangium sp. CS-047395 TaxID=3239936 RepID=UPI003D94FE9B